MYNIQETRVVSRQKGADADGSGAEKNKYVNSVLYLFKCVDAPVMRVP